ncbi:MAG: methyltransferase domain-containing protein [Ignavibacteria bacterium]|nr:methyltransferase domain-containing protein [Ignavibacteria bacterium]
MNEFDIIVSPLTIYYIRDLRSLFSESNRVLKTNGELFNFPTHHPFLDYSFHSDWYYFNTELMYR